MSTLSVALSPVRKVAYLLPWSIQHRIVRVGCVLVKALALFKPLTIDYRGYRVHLAGKDLGGREIYFGYLIHGRWNHERYEQTVVEKLLRKTHRTTVVDVGASYGMYSILAASLPNVERIVAIEAAPSTCQSLKRTIAQNRLEGRIQLLNAAACSTSGVEFSVIEMGNSEWNKVEPSTDTMAASVPSISIDDLLAQQGGSASFVFIKMDIEGYEPEAFKGMTGLLRGDKSFAVMFEFHVGLMKEISYEFAEFILSVPKSSLYLIDGRSQSLRRLDHIAMRELIENAMNAKHPLNLYNLMLLSDSHIGLLTD